MKDNYDIVELFNIPGIVVKVPTKWLVANSMIDTDILYNAHLLVRYNTIKSYMNKKNDYWEIYNKMQKKRVSQKKIIPREKAENEEKFKTLIDSILDNGYDDNYPIIVNTKLRLVDGSHRLAICLYLGIESVPIKIDKILANHDPEYSLIWFINNGFEKIAADMKKQYIEIMGEDYE